MLRRGGAAWRALGRNAHARARVASAAGVRAAPSRAGAWVASSGLAATAAVVAAAWAACADDDDAEPVVAGLFRERFPVVSLEELRSHDGSGPDGSVWVCMNRGVYDVTDFVAAHPGGNKLLQAAGGSVEPFWRLYAIHRADWVYELLEEMRIGNLSEADAEKVRAESEATHDSAGPFADEPVRDSRLLVRSDQAFNAETPPSELGETFTTPAGLFYVRNHLPVPKEAADGFEVVVEGTGIEAPLRLTEKDLRSRFERAEVTAVLQCGGNRRREMSAVRHVNGLDWDRAAIGNAVWAGPRLRDVLAAAGLPTDEDATVDAGGGRRVAVRDLHVQLEGADTDEGGRPYGASIPAWRAVSREADVLLAMEMNGEALPRDHGRPVRALVPGVVGSRSVKWLRRVVVAEEESRSFWQRKDYKALGPATDWANPDFDRAPSVYEMPVQAAVLQPLPEAGAAAAVVPPGGDDGCVEVKGYAWSGGGRGIARVDVSADGGDTWSEAQLRDESGQRDGRHWAWVLWSAKVPAPAPGEEREFVARAVDSSLNVQPERVQPQWSARGLLNNAWTRVKLQGAVPER